LIAMTLITIDRDSSGYRKNTIKFSSDFLINCRRLDTAQLPQRRGDARVAQQPVNQVGVP
jgi:hypothetical protein